MSDKPTQPVIIVMGVSGVGKSTIAEALDKQLHWPFQEGDALHPPSNVQKMHAGIPLTDEDRAPWLAAIKDWIDARGADTAVLYLATSPHLFPAICEQLGAAGLNGPHIRERTWAGDVLSPETPLPRLSHRRP